MPRAARRSLAQTELLDAGNSTAPAVPEIRRLVVAWREAGYPGATATTRTCFAWWVPKDGHRRAGGRTFRYHPFQREAVETLVYLYEAAGVRRQKALLEQYVRRDDVQLLQHDDFARYCLKMATGSGKTKVMSLAVAWQYLNAVAEGRDDYARTVLVIAPNVIVYERLRADFAGGRIFRADPVVPPELAVYWDHEVYLRGAAAASARGPPRRPRTRRPRRGPAPRASRWRL